MRIALAKLLLGRPTLLLLDEPTNHLDLDARNWLEEYLSSYPFAVILVSHDRFFLDAVVTRIAEISLRTITDYVGTYSQFLVERDARLEQLRKAKHEQDEEIARMRAFIDRFRYQATKAAQVQSRIKMLDKIVPIEVPPERKRVHFTFPDVSEERPPGARARAREQVGTATTTCSTAFRSTSSAGIGSRSSRPTARASRRSCACSSGSEAPDTGKRREGHQVVMQYFAQDEANRLPTRQDPSTKTMEADSPVGMVPMIRNILGGFLFTGDDIYKRAGVLSGGERTRLAVARMLLRPANTLLLDEPTNHLDLDSKDVLLEALEDFGGTLDLRLARPLLRRPAGHEGHRGRPRRDRGLSGHLRGVPLEQDPASGGRRRPSRPTPDRQPSGPDARRQARPGPRPPPRRMKKRRSPTPKPGSAAGPRTSAPGASPTSKAASPPANRPSRPSRPQMASPAFYDDRAHAETVIRQHQTLMWEVGDLMNQWEAIQAEKTSD